MSDENGHETPVEKIVRAYIEHVRSGIYHGGKSYYDFFNLEKNISASPPIKKTTPMTKLHYNIMSLLMPVCLETNKRMRKKYELIIEEIKTDDATKLKIEKLKKYLMIEQMKTKDEIGRFWGDPIKSTLTNCLLKQSLTFAALLTNQPEYLACLSILKNNNPHHDIYDPLSIIIRDKINSEEGDIPINYPMIVTHGNNRTVLNTLGKTSSIMYNYSQEKEQETRIATDEEIEACLSNLNPAQLRFIMNNDIFAPIIASLFEDVEEIVAEKDEEKNE